MRTAQWSEIGRREENQDAAATVQAGKWLVAGVFDGLGGHSGGRVAAQTACEAAMRAEGEPLNRLEAANQAVLGKQEEIDQRSMRTTAVLLMVDGENALWAHCGDSRLYRMRDGVALQLTLDHSVPQALVRQGEIAPEDIRFHEDRARLTRALGIPDVRISAAEDGAMPGDRYLLCSDGFWEPVLEEEMLRCMEAAFDPADWLQRMARRIEQAKDPKQDNLTAVAVWLDD